MKLVSPVLFPAMTVKMSAVKKANNTCSVAFLWGFVNVPLVPVLIQICQSVCYMKMLHILLSLCKLLKIILIITYKNVPIETGKYTQDISKGISKSKCLTNFSILSVRVQIKLISQESIYLPYSSTYSVIENNHFQSWKFSPSPQPYCYHPTADQSVWECVDVNSLASLSLVPADL